MEHVLTYKALSVVATTVGMHAQPLQLSLILCDPMD